jgi:hypothetical protein
MGSQTDIQLERAVPGRPIATLLLLLAGSATQVGCAPSAGARSIAKLEEVSFEHKSMGAILEGWTLKKDQVVLETPIQPYGSSGKLALTRFTLTADQRSRVQAAVSRIEHVQSLPETCNEYVPDGPYGVVSWLRSGRTYKMQFNGSCTNGAKQRKAAAAFLLHGVIKDAAK